MISPGDIVATKETKFPEITSWEFEERIKLEVDSALFEETKQNWKAYLEGAISSESFNESMRYIVSDEAREETLNRLIQDWLA